MKKNFVYITVNNNRTQVLVDTGNWSALLNTPQMFPLINITHGSDAM